MDATGAETEFLVQVATGVLPVNDGNPVTEIRVAVLAPAANPVKATVTVVAADPA